MSRFRIFALFTTLAVLTAVLAACGGGGDSSSEDPQKVIENASFEGVTSGSLDAKIGVKSSGAEGGDVNVTLSGPFQSGGKEALPEFDLAAKATGTVKGEPVDFEGGLTLLGDRAFVGFKGTEYEVDPTTFGFVKSSIEQAQQQGGEGGGANVTACKEAVTGLEVGSFVDNLKNEGSAEVDGTDTTKVSGDLDTAGAINAVIKLTENPACKAQLETAGPLPLSELESARSEIGGAIKKAHVEVYVGDDEIIRKVAAELTIEPKRSDEKVEVDLEVALSGVNEEQEISAPANAKPLEGLFQKLGVNPLELLEAGSGGGVGGIGNLLEGLVESSGSGGSGGSSGSAPEVGPSPQTLECFEAAKTSADLQKCATQAS